MHLVAYWNLGATAEIFIQEGADLSPTDSEGSTPLHWACSNGCVGVAATLLKHGAEINRQDIDGWMPLFWASFVGDTEIVRLLLNNDADYLVQGASKWTALHWAMSSGRYAVVQQIINQHLYDSRQKNKCTAEPLRTLRYEQIATGANTASTPTPSTDSSGAEVRLLVDELAAHAHVAQSSSEHDAAFSQIWLNKAFEEPLPQRLTWAMQRAKIKRYMVSDTDTVRWKSRLLRVAIRDEKFDLAQMLVEIGADVNDQDQDTGETALHFAGRNKDPKYVTMILQSDEARPNCLDFSGRTPLQLATSRGFLETTTVLLEAGANVNYHSNFRRRKGWLRGAEESSANTPLGQACETAIFREQNLDNVAEMVRLLLDRGADPLIRDYFGKTALHYALEKPFFPIISLLLKAGAKVDLADPEGQTPLHMLAQSNHLKDISYFDLKQIVQILLEGLDGPLKLRLFNKSHSRGRRIYTGEGVLHANAVIMAIEADNWDLFHIFVEHGAPIPSYPPREKIFAQAMTALASTTAGVMLRESPDLACGRGILVSLTESLASKLKAGHSNSSWLFSQFEDILTCLLTSGADVNTEDPQSKRPVLFLASRLINSAEVIQLLLDAGADMYHQDEAGFDPVLEATVSGNRESLGCLLRHAQKHVESNIWASTLNHQESDPFRAVCAILRRQQTENKRYDQGRTLLHISASRGDCYLVSNLLEYGADFEAEDNNQWLPVHHAGFAGHVDAVKLLLPSTNDEEHALSTRELQKFSLASVLGKKGPEGRTMFQVAVETNNPSLVKYLLDQGAAAEFTSDQSSTQMASPLYFAASNNYSEAASVLLQHGANVEAADKSGWRPLHIAALRGSTETIQVLLAAGANIRAVTNSWGGRITDGTNTSSGRYIPDHLRREASEPLYLAIVGGHAATVHLLLQSGANVYTKSPLKENLQTAVHAALKAFWHEAAKRLDVVQILIDHDAGVEGIADGFTLDDILRFKGHEALWEALRKGMKSDKTIADFQKKDDLMFWDDEIAELVEI